MKVLHAVSEIYPLVKTGGLADVAAALPPALAASGVAARPLVPAYPAFWAGAAQSDIRRPRTVTTIHNIGFPGWFPATAAAELGLPPESLSIQGLEYFGGVGFLKAGLYYADRITTVSRTYAREIQ